MSNPDTKRSLRGWSIWGGLIALGIAIPASVLSGHTRMLTLGFLALGLFIASIAYVPRKWLYLSDWGNLHGWMVGHIVLGTLFMVVTLLHGIGGVGVGWAGLFLWALTVVQVASGFWGLWELRATPIRYRKRFSGEDFMFPTAVKRRIGFLVESIEETVERRKEPFVKWFNDAYSAALDGTSTTVPELAGFPDRSKRHAAKLHEEVKEVVRLRKLKQRLDAVDRRSKLWLMIHVPTSVALTVFVTLHVLAWGVYA